MQLPFRDANWVLTIITLFLGILGFLSAEYGPFLNKPKIQFFTENRIAIGHDYGSLFIDFPVDFIKSGKGSKTIHRSRLYLQSYDGNFKVLFKSSRAPMSINDNISMRLKNKFIQEINTEKYNKFFYLQQKVKDKIWSQYRKERWPHKAYFIPEDDPDLIKIQNFVKKLMIEFTKYNKFKLLHVVYENEKEILWKDAFLFEIEDEMHKTFITKQLEMYDSIGELNSKIIQFKAFPFIEKLSMEETEKLFNSYSSYILAKP